MRQDAAATTHARQLRRDQTHAEAKLWARLRAEQVHGAKFRRQVPIEPYITDFCCFEPKLIVEIDGGQHAEHLEADAHRTAFLEHTGYRVLRFWNHDVLQSIEAVMERIDDEVHRLRRVSGGRAKQG